MIFSNKKAQISVFVIMGILLVAMIFLFFILKKEKSPETGGKSETERSNRLYWFVGLYFLGKYFTLLMFLKSESCVHITALNSCAVARMILSAMGSWCSRLSLEAAIANGALRSTTFPLCMATTACNASLSLDSLRMTLKTS